MAGGKGTNTVYFGRV